VKEITVISGKGGTGKTSVSASFAYLAGKNAVIADCDVDAADMHLLLNPDHARSEDFFSGAIAVINNGECIRCNRCYEVCHFEAITQENGNYFVNEMNCEGCGYCFQVCPAEAIVMEPNNTGTFYISKTRFQNMLVHAKMHVGAENSGKLVSKIRQEAKKLAEINDKEYIIIDGSPGIGCPVIASITGSDYIVLVTEPTISGFHDLKRVIEVVQNFKIKASCIINKSGLNQNLTCQIKEYLSDQKLELISELPYDIKFSTAITAGKTIVEYDDGHVGSLVKDSWNRILTLINR
jgi:MinD superfamily P-loop ATPase